jgi:hypothetical protein
VASKAAPAAPAASRAATARVKVAHAAVPAAAPAHPPASQTAESKSPDDAHGGGLMAWIRNEVPGASRLLRLTGSVAPADRAQSGPPANIVPMPAPKPAHHYRRTAYAAPVE